MSENNNNSSSINSANDISASQPTPEIFSDATGRFLNNIESPQKVYSASQPETSSMTTSSNGILKKGRKSLGNGRRVSFAATAHVRVFGNDEKAAEEERERLRKEAEAEEAEEQRQLEEFRKQFINENGPLEDLKKSLSEFEIKSSPAREIIPPTSSQSDISITPLKRPFNTVDQSFDVELKVDEMPSFSSYLSPEKDMMDLTGCVGNILDDLSSPMSANSRRQSQMDFTNCVGSILAQISKEADKEETESFSSMDDMEMTQSVGSLVQVANDTSKTISSLESSQNSDSMEMTQPIGSLIIESTNENVINPTISAPLIDVSFIEDCAQPSAFNIVDNMSPSKVDPLVRVTNDPSPLSQEITIDREETLQQSNELLESREISEKVDRESIQIAKDAVAKNEEMFQLFSIPKSSQITSNTNTSANFDKSTSFDFSNGASLKEFLNETGVRFLDNLSNMGRRETVGKPRDSTIITPSRRMYFRNVLVPETLAVEKACDECVRTIGAQRQFLTDEEGKFNHYPPLAYREFMKSQSESPERSAILHKLKTLKSVARLFARQSWYEWRKGFETNFRGELERVLISLKTEYGSFEAERIKLQKANSEQIEPKVNELSKELVHLKSRYESLSRSDWEQASQLHEIVMLEREKAKDLESELNSTLLQEASLRQSIENVLEQRRQLQERLVNLKHSCSQFEDCTELALTELKSTFALQEALNGWKLLQLRQDSLVIEYTRGTPVQPIQIRMNWDSSSSELIVSSILIESDSSALATLRPASQLMQPEFTSLPRSLILILIQLDNLVQLSRDLSLIKVQCDVQLLSVMNANTCESQLPLLLTFFNYEAKIKFDVIIGVKLSKSGEMNFCLLSFQNHYGPVNQESIQSALRETSADQFGLRRIVNTISNFLK